MINSMFPPFLALLQRPPQAFAKIRGNGEHPNLRGIVRFYQTSSGVVVSAEIQGLPNPSGQCESPIFAFHIHSGGSCTGNSEDPFANAGTHFNPNNCLHPYHAGDMPPLFGADGSAFSMFLTNRFKLSDVIGKTVIIHSAPDDFTTQPSGNSGKKIACGVIESKQRKEI